MGKKVASIIGIVLGIAIIIIGVSVMNPEIYTVGDPIMKFGADFYTEIYDVTREVGGAVQRAYKNICNAIGWLIVAIGLVDIAYFICKMASSEENTLKNTCDFVPTAAVSTMSPVKPVEKTMEHKESKISLATATHKWRCDNC